MAKLAGIPTDVIKKARLKLAELESSSELLVGSNKTIDQKPLLNVNLETQVAGINIAQTKSKSEVAPAQADLFATDSHPVVDAITSLDLDNMSPKQALDWLFECKKRV